jgi:hypothetical protein
MRMKDLTSGWMSLSDDLASEDVESMLGTLPAESKLMKELEVRDINIPSTPRLEIKSITLDSDNRVSSPSLDTIKPFVKELGESAEESPSTTTVAPPPAKPRESNLNEGAQVVESQRTALPASQNTCSMCLLTQFVL